MFLLSGIVNKSNVKDALCCAKSFYKSDLILENIRSNAFDIDIELTSLLLKKSRNFKVTLLDYKRRDIKDGKKLRLSDSWKILKRIIIS